jgi:hypothetical protein
VLSARASDVQHEYEHLFQSARILSDVRPLFNQSGTEMEGAMVVHNLKITYFQAGEYMEVFISLDNADLSSLRKVVERAEVKTMALEALIAKGGVPYFDSK